MASDFVSSPSPLPPPGVTSDRPRGARILLVEDEPAVRRLAAAVLAHHGYSVTEMAGPVEALACAEAHPDAFDLIVADVLMPGMRGSEMVRHLRPHQPAARVLYMSGYIGDPPDAEEPLQPLLHKPFRPKDLVEEVSRILNKR